jgi:hypothetical protein
MHVFCPPDLVSPAILTNFTYPCFFLQSYSNFATDNPDADISGIAVWGFYEAL